MNTFCRGRLLMLCCFSLMSGCALPGGESSESDESAAVDGWIGQTSQAVTQSDISWWKNLWQPNRNAAILYRADQDYANPPKYVGLNCKDWARKVVSDASHGVVNLPSTRTDGIDWQWSGSNYVQNQGSISAAAPGDIVQMHRNSTGIHTAIVMGNDGTNIIWIDSNWSTPEDEKVRVRTESIAGFIAAVTAKGVQKYTVYRITGG